ncbi:His Kinase A (phospho-acceptor) domain-containing protein [Xylanibacter ruminicola]|uniref:histidine kinase n=2 Tax=Bacteroidales TaxID=171549 RepID=A0A1H5WTE9_XYLRU|nr:His Kinase A (phospho-acceptor) domain-containing protein [Xylanibacter ruminicola]SEW28143.1 His Kinase A (phospho-acceptor) domain-containing protein [Prevotella sp. khp7]
MCKMRKYLFMFIMVILGGLQCFSQDSFRFYHIYTKGYRVKAIYRDTNNIMWVGTSFGLFTLPQLESRNPNGYNRQHPDMQTGIDGIYEDMNGRLWLNTHSRQVIRYNPHNNQFTPDIDRVLGGFNIHVVNKDLFVNIKDNNCLTWQGNKLYYINLNHKNVQKLLFDTTDEQVVNVISNQQSYIVLTTRHLYFFSSMTKELMRKAPLVNEVSTFLFPMVADDKGNVWISDDRHVRQYDYNNQSWTTSMEFPSTVSTIECGPDGHLWIGLENDGIYICDMKLNMQQHLTHHAGDVNGLKDNQIYMLHYEKANGTMWVSYAKGDISLYNKSLNYGMLYQVMDSGNPNAMTDVLSFAQTNDGKGLWMGLEDRGIYYKPLHNGEWTKKIGNASVSVLKTDIDNALWAGIYKQGLLRLSPIGSQQFYFKGESPYAIAFGPKNNIYVALQRKGVWCLDQTTGMTTDTHLEAQFVFDLKYVNNKLYAISTNGFYTMDGNGQWKKVYNGMFKHGCIDSQNYVYLLGEANNALGMTVLNPQGEPVSLPSGLEKVPSKVAALDKTGNLWAVSGNQLVRLSHGKKNGETWDYNVFNISPETEDIFYNPGAVHIDQDNHLWLGTDNGYQCINLNGLLAHANNESEEKPLVIGGISVNNEILSPNQLINGRELITHDVIFTKKLELNYNENNIMVECSSLFEEQTMTNTYYYQLRGFSDTWQPIEHQSIILWNLPPGKYQLYTKTQDSLESHLLDITINPPLWRTWWAYLIYLVVIACLLWILFRYYRNKRAYKMKLQQLELQQEQEKQLNEIKLRFFTNISHDLRTPLSLIVGPVEDLEARTKDPTSKSMLDMIHRNADLLLSLVNQILDFRRLELGNERMNLTDGNIVPIISVVCESFKLKAKKEGINLTFLPMVEDVEMQFDKDKMTKVMMNLLSNAFKFSRIGGCITVSIDVKDQNALIQVADTGIGIPDEEKPLIFNRFYQSSNNNLQAIGSGIGLHIVREYVRLHGGEITVQNNEGGHGSIFTITLPIHKSERDEEYCEISTEQHEAEHETTVLVVDDNCDFLTYVGQGLAEVYNIVSASNGKEALKQLQTNDVDIIISDVMMDEMDGLELCRIVKTDIATSHIPIILLTAKSQSVDELAGLEAGADDYVIKPFSMGILLQRVRNLVERNQQHHQRFKNEIDIAPSEITVTSLDEQFISNAISLVEKHISDSDFNVEELSSEMGVHRSQLYKKLQHLTGRTPIQFIRLLRLKRGRQLLEQSGLYVSEIAYQVGFNSPRVFSKYFKTEFGMTPDEYKSNTNNK